MYYAIFTHEMYFITAVDLTDDGAFQRAFDGFREKCGHKYIILPLTEEQFERVKPVCSLRYELTKELLWGGNK